MKKILIAVMAVFMLAGCGNEKAQQLGEIEYTEEAFDTGAKEEMKPILPEEECDFGNFQWGMALEDVANVHGSGYTKKEDGTIRYERVRIEGFASDAEYNFTDGRLSGATYFIMPDSEYGDKLQYLADYDSLKEKYTARFGAPADEEIQFAAGMETENRGEQAQLLGEGNILFRTVWKSPTTEIRVVMAQKDGICIGVKISPIQ